MENVWPLYGPVAGGTRVTITGQNLSTVVAVFFGQHRGVMDRYMARAKFRLAFLLSHYKQLTTATLSSSEACFFCVKQLPLSSSPVGRIGVS